jgi:prevent-host-death family protein
LLPQGIDKRVLPTPEHSRATRPPVIDRQLAEELEQYPGRWVAIDNGHVIASGDSLSDALARAREQSIADPLTFRVPMRQRRRAFYAAQSDAVPPTETISATEAHHRWADLLDRVARAEARPLVERDGTPAAALISAADFARFRQYEAARAEQYKALRFKARKEAAAAFASIPDEELEPEVAKAIAEVRTENHRRRTSRPPSRDRRRS